MRIVLIVLKWQMLFVFLVSNTGQAFMYSVPREEHEACYKTFWKGFNKS